MPDSRLIRTATCLRGDQHDSLRQVSDWTGTPVSWLIRCAIDKLLASRHFAASTSAPIPHQLPPGGRTEPNGMEAA